MSVGETQGGEMLLGQSQTVYAFAGEALAPEQLTTVEQMLGALGLRRVELGDRELGAIVEAEGKQEPEPVPVTRETFLAFAEKHDEYSRKRLCAAWLAVQFTKGFARDAKGGIDPYPPLRFFDENREVADLRSVHERLVASDMSTGAWRRATQPTIGVLCHIVNELLQLPPDEQLTTKFKRQR